MGGGGPPNMPIVRTGVGRGRSPQQQQQQQLSEADLNASLQQINGGAGGSADCPATAAAGHKSFKASSQPGPDGERPSSLGAWRQVAAVPTAKALEPDVVIKLLMDNDFCPGARPILFSPERTATSSWIFKEGEYFHTRRKAASGEREKTHTPVLPFVVYTCRNLGNGNVDITPACLPACLPACFGPACMYASYVSCLLRLPAYDYDYN
jgi:hypothetical protein